MSGTLTLQAIIGKFVVAVDEDIEPENAEPHHRGNQG
jgi:hypothetical protein